MAQWAQYGRMLNGITRALPWAVADWIIWGEDHYGEAAWQAIDEIGVSAQTVANYVAVGRKFPYDRRHPALSLSHHEVVAQLTPAEQERWLTKAETEGWPRSELRRALKGKETTEPECPPHRCRCGVEWWTIPEEAWPRATPGK